MNAHNILSVLSVDPSLGRIDKSSLSQQTLMELFIEGIIDNKEAICGDVNEIEDLTEWEGVECDGSDNVVKINWFNNLLRGSIDLKWLPMTTELADISWNELSGTVDLTCLPPVLEELNVGSNEFHGEIDLTALPPRMTSLFLYENNFHGTADFSKLPKSLSVLYVSKTQLEGEVWEFQGILRLGSSNVKDMRQK